jgi:hypothetical protein
MWNRGTHTENWLKEITGRHRHRRQNNNYIKHEGGLQISLTWPKRGVNDGPCEKGN